MKAQHAGSNPGRGAGEADRFQLLRSCGRRVPWSGAAIYLIDLQKAARFVRATGLASAWITPSDRRRLKRIRDTADRMQRQAAYIVLRMLVARALGPRHAKAAMLRPLGGAPRLAGVPINFNLSHSGRHALIALARRGRIGVDLEEWRAVPMSMKHRTSIVEAASTIGNDGPLEAARDLDLLQAWTRLESFSKATGRGINRTLADFGIRKQGNPRLHTPGDSVAERARRQIPNHKVHDLRLPLGLKGAVTRGF